MGLVDVAESAAKGVGRALGGPLVGGGRQGPMGSLSSDIPHAVTPGDGSLPQAVSESDVQGIARKVEESRAGVQMLADYDRLQAQLESNIVRSVGIRAGAMKRAHRNNVTLARYGVDVQRSFGAMNYGLGITGAQSDAIQSAWKRRVQQSISY